MIGVQVVVRPSRRPLRTILPPIPIPTRVRRPALAALLLAGLLVPLAGCQTTTKVRERRMIETILNMDFTGLKPPEKIEPLRVSISPPKTWETMPLVKTPVYAHQQWRSPSRLTGVGVAYARLPLPLSRGMVLWLARKEYTKRANDGRVIDQWDDDTGRTWFEGENKKYHVRGYVRVEGFGVWFVYYGHKTGTAPDPAEISLAARCVDTILPDSVKLPFPLRAAEVAEVAEVAKVAPSDDEGADQAPATSSPAGAEEGAAAVPPVP